MTNKTKNSENVRDVLVSCRVLDTLVAAVGLLCGAWSVSYPQRPDRRRHRCTVGIDWDPPVCRPHPGRMMLGCACGRTGLCTVVLVFSKVVCLPEPFLDRLPVERVSGDFADSTHQLARNTALL